MSGAVILGCSGCAAVGESLRGLGGLVSPEAIQTAGNAAQTAGVSLPEPMGIIVSVVGGGVSALGLYLYRRKLLLTDPASVK